MSSESAGAPPHLVLEVKSHRRMLLKFNATLVLTTFLIQMLVDGIASDVFYGYATGEQT